jgi:hypothetical protein
MDQRFFNVPEMSGVKSLLENSQRGINIHGSTKTKVQSLMQQLHESTDASRLMILLNILIILSNPSETTGY